MRSKALAGRRRNFDGPHADRWPRPVVCLRTAFGTISLIDNRAAVLIAVVTNLLNAVQFTPNLTL